jgi:hypothetical protein
MRTRVTRHLGALSPRQTAGLRLMALPTAARTQPPIDLPEEFSWHDYAVFLLSMAAEIEHSLMVQYLYAAYSPGGPQVPQDQRDKVLEWQQVVLGIAKEEMGHLVTVQNVLKVLGGPLHLDREDYPWVSDFYPYPFTLEPLSRQSLAKYVVAESPENWPDDIPASERQTIENLASGGGQQPVLRVGTLYDTIIGVLSNAEHIPDELFRAETYPFQASWDEWGRGYGDGKRGATPKSAPDVLVVRAASRTQAIAALKAVAEQGEAVDTSQATEDSHFRRFLQVYRDFSAVSGWTPTLALPKDPRKQGLGADGNGTTIQNPEASAWAGLFNLRYRMLLSYLAHAFQLSDDPAQTTTPGRRGQVINRIFAEMYNLKGITGRLVQLPLASDPAQRAGPPFQMPYTLNFPAAEPDFWRLHLDLIEASDRQRATIADETGDSGRVYLAALASADRQTAAEINAILQPGEASSRFLRGSRSVR